METSSDVICVLDFSSVFTDDFLLVVFVFTLLFSQFVSVFSVIAQ